MNSMNLNIHSRTHLMFDFWELFWAVHDIGSIKKYIYILHLCRIGISYTYQWNGELTIRMISTDETQKKPRGKEEFEKRRGGRQRQKQTEFVK